MTLHRHKSTMTGVLSIAALTASFAASSVWAQQKSEDAQTIAGERLDASLYGPGIVESWEDVANREANMPAQLTNPRSRNGRQGEWFVPRFRGTFRTHSGSHNVINTWGDVKMGIGFPKPADVQGAFFAGQADRTAWAPGVRVLGYLNGQLVATTEWFNDIGDEPKWFAMNLQNVDRIEIEAKVAAYGSGAYAMDDLTFTMPGEDGQLVQKVIDFEDCAWGQTLTGSKYAGLTWETGTGKFEMAVPGPRAETPIPDDVPPPAHEPGTDALGGGGTAPALSTNFNGPGDSGTFPPDTCGAVGPTHFCSIINGNFSVWNKTTGARLVNQSLFAFFNGGSGDPRILFDTFSNRWIAVDTDFNKTIFLAVSTSSSATGTWFKTSFNAMQGSDASCTIDFPTLGVDANGIYLSMWAFSSCGLSIFAIDKAPLIAASPSLGTVTAFRGLPNDGAILPVQTYTTPSPAGEYCISRQSSTQLRLRRINPPITSPTLTTLSSVTIPSHSAPPNVPALGSTINLENDNRPVNAVYRDGFIWTAHAINVGGRSAIRWYKVNASTSTLADSGTVDDPVRHYFYPSIAVNSFGEMVMGFSGSSANERAGAWYTGRASTDSAGQTAPPAQLKAGVAAYNRWASDMRNRWGDYTHTTVDPSDDSFWTIQEYVAATNTWGNWIGRLTMTSPPTNDDCANAEVVVSGTYPFSTNGASTDGPNEPGLCTFDANSQILADVWYKVLADCTGTMTASLCGSAFNTKMALYPNSCPVAAGTVLACNDSFCGNNAQLTFPVSFGEVYLLRIGSPAGTTGAGTLVITCTPSAPPCPADINHDNQVNVSDLLSVINSWGACPGCAADINHDNQVNVTDLLAIINAWGPCPQ